MNYYGNLTGKYVKIFLVFTVTLNFLLAYKFIKEKYFRHELDFTYNRLELFEHLNIQDTSLVFIGTSLTEQYELAELLNKSNIRNRGINGNNTYKILNRLSVIIQGQPKKIFMEAGINDLAEGVKEEILLENYKKILDTLRQNCKTTKLYVQSLLPVNDTGILVINAKLKNSQIQEVNSYLQKYCLTYGITYINLFDKFSLNGKMNPRFCIADGVHLSGDGYLLWTKILQQYVNQ